jgi:hypothetical protein
LNDRLNELIDQIDNNIKDTTTDTTTTTKDDTNNNNKSLVIPKRDTIDSRVANLVIEFRQNRALLRDNISKISSTTAPSASTLIAQSVLLYSKTEGTLDTTQLTPGTSKQKLIKIFGIDAIDMLICDNTHEMRSNNQNQIVDNKSNNQTAPPKMKTPEELNTLRRNKADEYYRIEEKQAHLVNVLAKKVYHKLYEENQSQQFCDIDDLNKVFYVIVELEKVASLVHHQVAEEIKKRINENWQNEPYFGDILIKFYHFYKIYKAILQRYPICQLTLSQLLKKKAFVSCLQRLLDAELVHLDKVNRLDMILDRLVDLPRRCIQLLESYLKLLNKDCESTEYSNITKVLTVFNDIHIESNEALNKSNNFRACYNLQTMIEPFTMILDNNRLLIKEGPLHKVCKRNGELQLRHFALFTDMLLVSKCDKIKKKLLLNRQINSHKLKLIENSNVDNPLMFRVVSTDQNNEFMVESAKEKESWLQAFRKVSNIEIEENAGKCFSDEAMIMKIGKEPPIWVKDSEKHVCSGCSEHFTTFRRRHHCRTCGKIYCNSCCNFTVYCEFDDFKEKQRVCKSCYHLLYPLYEKYCKDNDIINNSFGAIVEINPSNHRQTTTTPTPNNINADSRSDSMFPLSSSYISAANYIFNR